MKTKNQQPYFPHDTNTRNKDKIIRMRIVHGVAGYGVYFMLLERLRSDDYFEGELDYGVLAYDFDCDEALVRSVINDFGLFEIIDDGRRFHSVELTEQMRSMMEAKERRAEIARKAAEARWGKKSDATADVKGDVTSDSKASLFTFCRLDEEIQQIQNDTEWSKAICKEFNLTEDYLDEKFWDRFRNRCICNGKKDGHRDMGDAYSHCRGFIGKEQEKNPDANSGKDITTSSSFGVAARLDKAESVLLKATAESNRRAAEDAARRRDMDKKGQSGDNVYRNFGYEPTECTMQQLFNPEWRNANPPSHPEWIGLFTGKETVEEVMSKLEPVGI